MESVEEAKHLSKEWDWTLVPGFTASKILWLKNNEPENFSKLAKVLLPHDYFNYFLTGRYCMEVNKSHSTASCIANVHPTVMTQQTNGTYHRIASKPSPELMSNQKCQQCICKLAYTLT